MATQATQTGEMTEYVAEYIPATDRQWVDGRCIEIYRGPSRADARRACAVELGYRDLRSAATWTGETETGEDAEFFARRRGLTEASAVARIVARTTVVDLDSARAEYDVQR